MFSLVCCIHYPTIHRKLSMVIYPSANLVCSERANFFTLIDKNMNVLDTTSICNVTPSAELMKPLLIERMVPKQQLCCDIYLSNFMNCFLPEHKYEYAMQSGEYAHSMLE